MNFPPRKGLPKRPCELDGCTGHYTPKLSKSRLCIFHMNKMLVWEYKRDWFGSKCPPPFVEIDGRWTVNPEKIGYKRQPRLCAG